MKRVVLVLVLVLAGCTSSSKAPQVHEGAIRGVVVADDGKPLPGVTLVLHTTRGKITHLSDANGHYEFANVLPGVYRLEATLAGVGTRTTMVSVGEGGARDVKVTMTRARNEGITVLADAAPAVPPPAPLVTPRTALSYTKVEQVPVTAYYAPIAENEYADANKQPMTTFSIDVDGASYANVRRFLTSNLTPPPDAVRIEEMINYFTYRYPQPSDGRPVAISTEVAACPWAPEHRLLRVGLQAKSVEQWKLAPNNLVFLLDVSGSMAPPDRLPLVKSAMRMLVEHLAPADTVAIVVYAGAAGLALPPTPASRKDIIVNALDHLQAGGSTAGGQGIELAYKVAADHLDAHGNNRVILATDGDFNVGVRNPAELTTLIEEKRKSGIYLTCIGVGTDNLQDGKIELLADKGNGNYYYLDTIEEAKKVFGAQLTGTLVAVADDVKVQIEFNPALVASYRQIGYENRAMENKDFTDDTKDAGELGSGQSVTALYEIVPSSAGAAALGSAHPQSGSLLATIRLRYKDPGSTKSQAIAAAAVDDGKSAYDATPDTQFAAAVAEFGMLLRNSKHKGRATFGDVAALARAMRGEDIEGYREELIRLVESSRTIMGEQRVANQ